MHPAGNAADAGRRAALDRAVCEPLQHGAIAQRHRLRYARRHAGRPAEGDSRRARSQTGGGAAAPSATPASGMTMLSSSLRFGATMTVPGETEAGSAGKQPCRGITWWAHRDDENGACGCFSSAPPPNSIGSVDPHALKIPARRAESSLTEHALIPFQAEPGQLCWTGHRVMIATHRGDVKNSVGGRSKRQV